MSLSFDVAAPEKRELILISLIYDIFNNLSGCVSDGRPPKFDDLSRWRKELEEIMSGTRTTGNTIVLTPIVTAKHPCAIHHSIGEPDGNGVATCVHCGSQWKAST
jgi:hypothetical protein